MKKHCDNCGEKQYNGYCTNCHEAIYIRQQYEDLDLEVPESINKECLECEKTRIKETK